MTILMDYEGYTFVFFYQKNKLVFFSLKCDIYYAFTFKPSKNLKMQVAYICLKKIKGK